ncbi:MAG: DEAD/DEAH box helicase, partial [Pseudomonadota bacterium]
MTETELSISGGNTTQDETDDQSPPHSFAEMDLDPAVKQALDEMGYETPMQVQTAIYQHVLEGHDLVVQSRTGSGKTAAFGIPIVQMLSAQSEDSKTSADSVATAATGAADSRGGRCAPASRGRVQALILAPTRELALQTSRELTRIAAYRDVKVAAVYGGAPMGRQIEALRAGAKIVAGTPGRILDHIRRETLKLDGVRILVLDECDEMLSMGFREAIETVIAKLPRHQTLLLSATIPDEIEQIAARHLHDPVKISLSEDFVGVHEVRHQYYLVSGLSRTNDLLRVLEYEQPESAIVFCNTRDDTAAVAAFLKRNGLEAEAISSDLAQQDRERVMGLMRDKKLRFLVATDIAARGIDISDLSHVICYTFPEAPELYVHRTGRTGRAGKSGIAISLVGPRELGSLYYVKLLYKIKPEERELPSEIEIKTRREGERFAQVAGLIAADSGDEWRSLARRVWHSGDGERIVAVLLERLLRESAPQPDTGDGTRQQTMLQRSRRACQPESLGHGPGAGREEEPAEAAIRTEGAMAEGEPRDSYRRRRERNDESSSQASHGGYGNRGGHGNQDGHGRRGPLERRRGSERAASTRVDDSPDRSPACAAGVTPAPTRDEERDRERMRRSGRPGGFARKRTEPTYRDRHPENRNATQEPAASTAASEGQREFWENWANGRSTEKPSPSERDSEGHNEERAPVQAAVPSAAESVPAAPTAPAPAPASSDEPGFQRLFLNIGRREGLRVEDVSR